MINAREIYEVHIGYVNDQGYHACDPAGMGYPKVIDSKTHNHDLEVTRKIAYGYLGAAESTLSSRSDQVSYAYLIRVNDGFQVEKRVFGKVADVEVPDQTGGEE